MSNIDIPNVVPELFLLDEPATGSKSVLRKRLHEYIPSEQTTFSKSPNNLIRFNVSSNSDFISMPESYLKFNLLRTEANAYTASGEASNIYLDKGGVHNLFRSIEVRSLSSGMLIQRVDYYFKHAQVQKRLYQSINDVELMGELELDFEDWGFSTNEDRVRGNRWEFLPAAASYASPNSTYAANTVNLAVGDLIRTAAGTFHRVSAATYTTDGLINTVQVLPDVTLAAGGPLHVLRQGVQPDGSSWSNQFASNPLASVAANNAGYTCIMKPLMSIFGHTLPLFLMKGGVEIIFELEEPHMAFVSSNTATTVSFDYSISGPRFMGMMVTAHPDIVTEFAEQWKTQRGLVYRLPSVRVRRRTSTERDSTVLQFPIGVRSARRAFLFQGHQTDEADTAVGRAARSASKSVIGQMSQYQMRVGSHEFPHQDVVTSLGRRETYEQLLMTAGHMSANNVRLSYAQFDKFADTSNYANYMLGVDFSRLQGSNSDLTGIDLSVTPLDIDIRRSTSMSDDPVYYLVLEYDAFFKISAGQMSIML